MPPIVPAFLLIFAAVCAAMLAAQKCLEDRRKRRVTELLSTVARVQAAAAPLLKETGAARGPLVERLFGAMRRSLENQIRQAGLDWTPERLAGLCALAAGAGIGVGLVVPVNFPPVVRAAVLAAVMGVLPVVSLRRARAKRLAAFEEQFPDALDFMARSMRAGHAFTVSLEMLGDEMPEPLSKEIRTLFNEQNLGAPLEEAMRKLTDRVPLLDVRFFASAVLLQKQTGGNLNEILSRLAYVIRERFRLKGQVKAASAHGRATAGILGALPLITCVALLFVAPGYMQGMMADPDGKLILAGCVVAQVIGNLVIRRIIDIKV
ncbi:MAG TPA: type II secretion system F family protein [Bryobacteraceae bacterium]|nr:type II secretion system F family protein [Bryobacteraceae bacterium]